VGERKVGDPIPGLAVTPDKYLPHRYAGASGDFNPIHIDPEFAKAVGLPRNILHGLYSMALVARGCAGLADGDPRALKRLGVQFRGLGVPEAEIRVSGSITAIAGDRATIDVVAEQNGNEIIRNATAEVELPG
jgi:acyl dehydratase